MLKGSAGYQRRRGASTAGDGSAKSRKSGVVPGSVEIGWHSRFIGNFSLSSRNSGWVADDKSLDARAMSAMQGFAVDELLLG